MKRSPWTLNQCNFRRVATGMPARAVAKKPPKDARHDKAGDAVDQHGGPPARTIDLANGIRKCGFKDEAITALHLSGRQITGAKHMPCRAIEVEFAHGNTVKQVGLAD